MIARSQHLLAAVLLLALSFGCDTKTYLINTPTVALTGGDMFANLPPEMRTVDMEILYAADRNIVSKSPILGIQYGHGRSGQLAVGVATVALNPPMDWEQLSSYVAAPKRKGKHSLFLKSAMEFGSLAVPLSQMEVREGRYRLSNEDAVLLKDSELKLHEELAKRLKYAPRKDVYLYVHGFNNSFEDAVFRLGMMWHMAGRPGVPIAYTWPAGRGGLTGYAYDRESGEFTIFHLKKFIKAVAACPDVERIHLIAHSRGTDVVCTALRELNIETRAKNLRTQEQLKLENLVLAAPDMDADVFEQRFAIEDLHLAARRVTVYLSSTDLALAISDWLFDSRARMGNLTTDKISEDAKTKLSQLKNFWFIDCRVKGFSSSHDYVFAHPAVLSDLILLLRDDRDPGAENGRPMKLRFACVWEIDNDYLLNLPKVLTTQPAAAATQP